MVVRTATAATRAACTTVVACSTLAVSAAAHAVQVCDLDGQPVNPANGYTTQGKTGLMRCREGEGGPVVREQELRNGVFMGVVRYYRDGVLEKEYRVNERGNRDGLAREFAAARGTNTLLREETYRDGTSVGRARTWHPNGTLRRVSQHGDDGREQAVAEFTPQAQLQELRCSAKPVLAPDFDDAKACGFSGASTVTFYGASGVARGRATFERGERTAAETLGSDGRVLQRMQADARGGSETGFGPDGTKRRETQWVNVALRGEGSEGDAGRPRRVTVLDREYSETGTLVRERRWRPGERGAATPEAELRWYLNGQPRSTTEYVEVDGQPVRRETAFHDNGKKAFEGTWLLADRGEARPSGVHRSYDAEGRLRREQQFDARGRIARERELDEGGRVTRDDEVFEDGSRKAYAR